tara:strand:- start:10796 stop:11770 length:975 start_codon:yes stop_codon:yes gene_type:complete
MANQKIFTGSAANDGTGDTLRNAAIKINANFSEVYTRLSGDSTALVGQVQFAGDGVKFEGTSTDSFNTVMKVVNPTGARIATLPDKTGAIIVDSATQTLKNKTILSPTLTTPSIKDLDSNHSYNFVVSNLAGNRNVNLPQLNDSDTFVFNKTSATLLNKSLTSPTITTGKVITGINDANGARLMSVVPTASAVYNVTLTNGDSGTGFPTFASSGNGTDINLQIDAKGMGAVSVKKLAMTSSTITSNGTVSDLAGHIVINSLSGIAVAINDGTTVGEQKILTNKGAGTATVTPTNLADGTSFTLATTKAAMLIWDGTNWFRIVSA